MVLRTCSHWCYHSEGNTNCGPQKSSSSFPTICWNLRLNILNYSCSFKLQLFFPCSRTENLLLSLSTIPPSAVHNVSIGDSLPYYVFVSLAIFYVFSLLFLCRSCSGTFQLFLRRNCPINRCRFGRSWDQDLPTSPSWIRTRAMSLDGWHTSLPLAHQGISSV